MFDEYEVLKAEANIENKIKKSIFIASGKEVATKKEAEKFISEISKKYYTAGHNCYAYKVGYGAEKDVIFRYSDDGEPSGTAGMPIMNHINGENLTNTVIVVTRYFGGIKLGTGGLIKAYGGATKELIQTIGKNTKIIYGKISIEYNYNITSQVMHIINNFKVGILENEYTNIAKTIIKIRLSDKFKFKNELLQITNAKAKIIDIE